MIAIVLHVVAVAVVSMCKLWWFYLVTIFLIRWTVQASIHTKSQLYDIQSQKQKTKEQKKHGWLALQADCLATSHSVDLILSHNQ